MFFTRLRTRGNYQLKLYGNNLEMVETFRFLGVHFDSRLTWKNHIKNVSDKCKKVIHVLRCLVVLDWGAEIASLLHMYKALIKSRLDYGSVAYGSASETSLKQLDVIQARALRICIWAVRTSPVCAIQVETGKMPLGLRRKQLLVNYWVNLIGHEGIHPTKKVLQACWESKRVKEVKRVWMERCVLWKKSQHQGCI